MNKIPKDVVVCGSPITYTTRERKFPSNFFINFFLKQPLFPLIILVYGVLDSILTLLILYSPHKELNPIANYNFYLFIIIKILVIGIIYIICIEIKRNYPGYILLFLGVQASIINLWVLI